MTSDRSALRAAGAWLASASLLLVLTLALHGPLHPDIEVQMARIAESASRWAVAHWIAAASLSCFMIASLLLLVHHSRAGRLDLRPVRGERTALTPKSKVLGRDSFKGMGVAYTYPDGADLPTIVVSNITTEFGLEESALEALPGVARFGRRPAERPAPSHVVRNRAATRRDSDDCRPDSGSDRTSDVQLWQSQINAAAWKPHLARAGRAPPLRNPESGFRSSGLIDVADEQQKRRIELDLCGSPISHVRPDISVGSWHRQATGHIRAAGPRDRQP